MKRVGIIGASGMAGSAIYKLAAQNPELNVVGIARHEEKAKQVLGEDANLIVGDIFTMPDSELKKFDVIIDAFATSPSSSEDQIKLAEKLVTLARNEKIRLIFILGAGSLHTGEDDHLVVDDLAELDGASDWIATPKAQLKELEYLEGINDVDWLGISPAMTFEEGPATDYTLGSDDLLFNDNHESKVTSGTMAKLVVEETINPEHHQERITLVDD